jgi:hypothetical protein
MMLFGACVFSSSALADGGPPAAYGILFDPGNPSHIIIRSQFWGLFDGHEGAPGWSLLCSQAFGGFATIKQNFPAVVAQGGRILVAADFEGLNMSDDECTWRTSDAFGGAQIISIAPIDASRTGFVTVTALGMNGGTMSRVYLSADRGDTWKETAGKLLLDFSVMDVAVAPSDPDRIYVVGVMVNGGPRMIGTSTDGGASWAMLPVGAPDQYTERASSHLSIVGIDPAHPGTLFVRADGPDDVPPVDDELWASSDAGKTWIKSYAPSGNMAGFAFSADGKRVFIGGIAEGIKVATVEDAVAGKAGAFRSVFSGKVWGLGMNAGKLYAGTDDFAMKPPFMLGVSADEGATFAPVMNHCEVSFPSCPASSTMELRCREQWERVGGYVFDLLDEGKGCDDRIGNGGAAGAAGMGGAPAVTSGGAASVASGGGPAVASGGSPAMASAAPGAVSNGQSGDCSIERTRSSIPFSTIALVAGTAAGIGFRRRRRQ